MTVCTSCRSWGADCWKRYNTAMTPREYLRLNAWQKWQLFRRPPWKFIINFLIVILTTTQVVLLNTYFAPFNRANVATWNHLLAPKDGPSEVFGSSTTYFMYRVPDVVDHVKQVMETYHAMQNTSVDYFEFFYENGDPTKPLPVQLSVSSFSQGPSIFDLSVPFDQDVETKVFRLYGPGDIGPFDESKPALRDHHELNTYVHCIRNFELSFAVRNYELAGNTRLCFKWDVKAVYDFAVRGRIDMRISTSAQLCPEERRVAWYKRAIPLEIVVYFFLVFLAFISQVLHLKAIYRSIVIFQIARTAGRKTRVAQSVTHGSGAVGGGQQDQLGYMDQSHAHGGDYSGFGSNYGGSSEAIALTPRRSAQANGPLMATPTTAAAAGASGAASAGAGAGAAGSQMLALPSESLDDLGIVGVRNRPRAGTIKAYITTAAPTTTSTPSTGGIIGPGPSPSPSPSHAAAAAVGVGAGSRYSNSMSQSYSIERAPSEIGIAGYNSLNTAGAPSMGPGSGLGFASTTKTFGSASIGGQNLLSGQGTSSSSYGMHPDDFDVGPSVPLNVGASSSSSSLSYDPAAAAVSSASNLGMSSTPVHGNDLAYVGIGGAGAGGAVAAPGAVGAGAGGIDDPNAEDDGDGLHTWSQLSLTDKLRFFNVWFLVATIGNVCNIVGPLLSIHDQIMLESNSYTRLYFLGLGCMMAWICVVQYFEGAASYYVLITTLRKGTPRVCRFLIGVLPVFLGYAMFGVAFFSTTSNNFATVDAACVTLFSLLNGDVIHDIFDDLFPTHPTISRIYLYTFICLFIYAVLNIFIAIIEDAFFASKAFQLHGQPELEDKEKTDQVDPLLLLEFEGMFGDGDDSSSNSEDSDSDRNRKGGSDNSDNDDGESGGGGGSGSNKNKGVGVSGMSDDEHSGSGSGSGSVAASPPLRSKSSRRRASGKSSSSHNGGGGGGGSDSEGSAKATSTAAGGRSDSESDGSSKKSSKEQRERDRANRRAARAAAAAAAAATAAGGGGGGSLNGSPASAVPGSARYNAPSYIPQPSSSPSVSQQQQQQQGAGAGAGGGSMDAPPSRSFALDEMQAQGALWPSANAALDAAAGVAPVTGAAAADASSSAMVPNTTSSSNAVAAVPAGVSGDFLQVLAQAQSTLNAEFTQRFASFVQSAQAQQKTLRPPHHPSFFPCGFSDCVYCVTRSVAAKTMGEVQRQLQAAFGVDQPQSQQQQQQQQQQPALATANSTSSATGPASNVPTGTGSTDVTPTATPKVGATNTGST